MTAAGDIVQLSPDEVLFYEWLTAWYNSAISFALVEVNARTANQLMFVFTVYVVNAMINAFIIGVFIENLSVKNAVAQEKQDEIDTTNTTMENLHAVPFSLKS